MTHEYKWWENVNPCPKCESEDLFQGEGDTIAWTLWVECVECGYYCKRASGRLYEETSKESVDNWNNISSLEKELL